MEPNQVISGVQKEIVRLLVNNARIDSKKID